MMWKSKFSCNTRGVVLAISSRYEFIEHSRSLIKAANSISQNFKLGLRWRTAKQGTWAFTTRGQRSKSSTPSLRKYQTPTSLFAEIQRVVRKTRDKYAMSVEGQREEEKGGENKRRNPLELWNIRIYGMRMIARQLTI